jgi:hypothetical protein
MHNNVYKTIVDEPVRQGIQDLVSVLSVSLNNGAVDQDTLGRETSYS